MDAGKENAVGAASGPGAKAGGPTAPAIGEAVTRAGGAGSGNGDGGARPAVRRMSIVREFALFLRENRAYWMVPIVVALLLLAALVVLGGSAASAFIYTLF